MRTSGVDILIVPGWSDSGPDHWQSRWERSLATARRIVQDDWKQPDSDRWATRIIDRIAEASRPAVLVAHSLGVAAVAHAAMRMPPGFLAGAFLVAPADVDNHSGWPQTGGEQWPPPCGDGGFAPIPLSPFPFPSVLIASSNDPYCSIERSRVMSAGWGATLVEAGDAGHINAAAGFGPWPDGLLRFGTFLREL